MIGGPVGPALEGQQPFVGQLGPAGETRFVKLRAEVVVIEHEPGAFERPEGHGERPEDVRRIAGLNHREAAGTPGLEHGPGGGEERVGVLGDEAELAATGSVRPVLVQLH